MATKYLYLLVLLLWTFLKPYAQSTLIQYLSGRDKDQTVQWDFFCTKGRNSGKWTKINVPSQWEMQGFGSYMYGHDKVKSDEQGLYKYNFAVAKEWQAKNTFIVFEGVMTDAEVKINGREAGRVHQGGFYQFSYNISPLLKYGESNVLEVKVSKQSANASVNRAERNGDFWALSGIYRPVYLKIVPPAFIDRVAIDAKDNGDFGLQVFSQQAKKTDVVEVQLEELNGTPVGKPFRVPAADSAFLKNKFTGIKTWNPEKPYLYNAVITLKDGNKKVHTIQQRFGFRTAELRPKDGFYVNGVKVIFKGVNRHSAWPQSGRTLSRQVHLLDIQLMKEMNMNAVRMSHYPPDPEFLDLCDSLGLFVLDELTGWQAAYDTAVGRKVVKELVVRDVNHPSVVMWANGNEGGWNRALDGDFHLYDPQKRLVYHPWEKFNGTETKHYPDFNYVVNSALYGNEVYFPTEFMHGLYDGGHGAGLDDFWNEMLRHPYFAGGFLWAFHDEGIIRTDKDSMMDTDGNHAPDGIVGPYREKEGSFYTIREIWSPVVIHNRYIPAPFNGRLSIENRFLYSNLNGCRFEWQLKRFPKAGEGDIGAKVVAKGSSRGPSLAPGEKGGLPLSLPGSVDADALFLSAFDPAGKEIYTWSWPLKSPGEIQKEGNGVALSATGIEVKEERQALSVLCDGISYFFDKETGYLTNVFNGKRKISLSGGPALATGHVTLDKINHYQKGWEHIVEVVYKGEHSLHVTWTFGTGKLPKLTYDYSVKGSHDFMGITFNYPEEKIKGMKWLGQGPYRVWKNRLRGTQFGIWQKEYNNTVTGESWSYPEFKGWHAGLYWVKVENEEAPFTIYTESNALFLQMLKPASPKGAFNENTSPSFPAGNIGFMHAISAVGTKFQPAAVMGPQSGKNSQLNYTPLRGILYFDFRAAGEEIKTK